MKRISIAEANKNLSSLARIVEKEGIAILTKHGKDCYVFMSKEYYEESGLFEDSVLQEIASGFYRKTAAGDIVHIEEKSGVFTLYSANFSKGSPSLLSIVNAPKEAVDFRSQGETLEVRILPKAQVNETFIERTHMEQEEHLDAFEKMMLRAEVPLKMVKVTGPLEVLKEQD